MRELVPAAIPFVGGFESTYQPVHDRDVIESTEHDRRWRADFALLQACGVRQLRYPVRWHRIEAEEGTFDWAHTDAVLGELHDLGIDVIVDLFHHTSHPAWLGHIGSSRFAGAFLQFVERIAARYPWIRSYTVCNEPLTTLLLCGQLGVWPPYGRGLRSFVRLASTVVPAVNAASRALADLLPSAEHVHVEVCERHSWSGSGGERTAALANDRRFLMIDLMAGRTIDPARPFVEQVARLGGDQLLTVEPGHIDVLGLDYYAHNQWHWFAHERGTTIAPAPPPLADLLQEYAHRYALPVALTETNIRGYAEDRVTWLKYTLEQCERAAAAGVDVRGYCWFPFIDSADWASLLVRCESDIDPVGVFWLDERLDRRPSVMSAAYSAAARGTPAAELPAFTLRQPCLDLLAGWLPHMAEWTWLAGAIDPMTGRREPQAHERKANKSDVA